MIAASQQETADILDTNVEKIHIHVSVMTITSPIQIKSTVLAVSTLSLIAT